MQKYANVVQDNNGTIIASVSVTVKLAGTGTLATLFSDNGVTGKSNPFTNDADGSFECYAANGHYDITYAKAGYTFDAASTADILFFDSTSAGAAYPSPVITTPTITGGTMTSPAITTPTITSPTVTGGTFAGSAATADPVTALGLSTKQYTDAQAAIAGSLVGVTSVINPNMEVWQRGTSFAAAATGTYAADRWLWGQSGAGVVTLNRTTTVPSVGSAGLLFNYGLEVAVTTADAAISAGDLYVISQRIEGANWRHFAQRAITVSFWVSSTKTGIHCLALRNNATGTPDRCYVAEFTVNVTNTWEYKTVSVSASPSAGTWDYTTGSGIELTWVLTAGSTFHTTANAWQTGNFYATSSQVNAMDSTSNFFRLTGVRLDVGNAALAIQYRSFQEELALCQRYYRKTFLYGTTPAQNVGVTTGEQYLIAGKAGAASEFIAVAFDPPMRATPTMVTFNPLVANAEVRDRSANGDCSATVLNDLTARSGRITATGNAGTAVGNLLAIHWTADAEL